MKNIQPIIKTENLKVIYDLGKSSEVRALDGVSLEVFPQEYVIFFGPSGCGKSTLLYCFLGLQRPTYGKVLIEGRDLFSLSPFEQTGLRQKKFGIIFQAYYLIPTLITFDNVILPQVFQRTPFQKRKERADILLKRFQIEDQAQKFPSSLSGGQQQRAAIARALISDPEVLLADEPVGNLDSASAEIVMETLREINELDKKTVILVTHDPRFLHYAHRVIYLKDGKVEREVLNPEKTQIVPGKGQVISEIERLARIYPYLSPEELKAKSLTNYLVEELTAEQIEKLEKTIQDLILEKISEENFYQILDKPYEEGGVGLYVSTARAWAEKIERILKEVKDYRESLRKITIPTEKEKMVQRIQTYLLDDYQGQVLPEQLERLKSLISDRILGIIDKKVFFQRLDLPLKAGGVGLNRRTARIFTRKIELLLAQVR